MQTLLKKLRRERAFVNIRIFNPFAPSNRQNSITPTNKVQNKEKKRQYSQRIREVEHGSFFPVVFSSTGEMAKEATIFYKRLASLLSEKREQLYSITLGWLRCTMCFLLLCSSIQWIRRTRPSKG